MKPRFLLHRWGFLAFLLLLFGGACLPAATPCTTAADCTNPSAPACFQGRCQAASCTSDLDCSDPALPSCQAGSCQPRKTACQGPLDCNDPQRPVCSQGVCQPRPSECSNDRDCPSERFFCQQGVCWLRSLPCVKDTDCKEPTPRCLQGSCQIRSPECVTNADCRLPSAAMCREGSCQPECTSSTDCKEPQLPQCLEGSCRPGCTNHLDCKDPLRPSCIRGLCQRCLVHLDCGDPLRPACIEGLCQPAPPECVTSSDCKFPERPRCFNNECVPPLEPCRTNGDCTHPERPNCQQGLCATQPCTKDPDCTDPTTPMCKKGRCTAHPSECTQDADCTSPSKRYCVAFLCQTAPFSCSTNGDCVVVGKELCQAGICTSKPVACTRHADCQSAAAPRCWDGACGPLCRTSADCRAKSAACLQGQCSLCADDLDCPSSLLCHRSACVTSLPFSCTQDGDCQTAGLLAARCLSGRCLRLHRLGEISPLKIVADTSEPFGIGWQQTQAFSESEENSTGSLLIKNLLTTWLDLSQLFTTGKSVCSLTRWDSDGKLRWEAENILSGSTGWAACQAQIHSNGDTLWLKPSPSLLLGSLALERLSLQKTSVWETRLFSVDPDGFSIDALPSVESRTLLRVFPDGGSLVALGGGIPYIPSFYQMQKWVFRAYHQQKPFLIKVDSTGKVMWVRFFAHPFSQVETDDQGSFYIFGVLTSSNWEGQPVNHQGETDIFVAKFDRTGRVLWMNHFGGKYLDCPGTFRISKTGRIFLTATMNTSHCSIGSVVGFTSNAHKSPDSLPPSQTQTLFGTWELHHPNVTKDIQVLVSMNENGRWESASVLASSADSYPPLLHNTAQGRIIAIHSNEDWEEWSPKGQQTWRVNAPLLNKTGYRNDPSITKFPPYFSSSFTTPSFYTKGVRSFMGIELPAFHFQDFSTEGERSFSPLLSLDFLGEFP